jgi:hypothetical protein
MGLTKKKTIEQIKHLFEVEGYTLVSTEYVNNYTHIESLCPNKHQHKTTYSNWQQGHRCKYCNQGGYDKLTYEMVKLSFEVDGYELLSTEYVNSHQKLEYICPNKHHGKITRGNWQQGQRCRKCVIPHNTLTYNNVKQSFESEGYTLLSTEYKNAHEYLKYVCPNGHYHRIIYSAWQQGQRCGKCDIKTSKQERELQVFAKEIHKGLVLTNDRTTIQNPITGCFLELDIYMPEIKKAIEYGAEHWHTGKYEKWKDSYKQQWCKDNGIELKVIDHNKWIKNKDWNMIREFIGV